MSSIYGSLFRRVLFPLYETGLRRRKTLAYMAEYERNQSLSRDELDALQWQKLERLLAHCWNEVPYYARRWREAGAQPGDIRTHADFTRLPRLTKQDVRDNFDDLHARGFRSKLLYKNTGGSTGEPMKFGYTRESYERRIAVMWRGYGWAGARMGDRTLYIWGAPIAATLRAQKLKERLYHAAFNRSVVNAFMMSEKLLPQYGAALQSFRPETVVGYVGPLVRMAEWLLANGRSTHRPQRVLCAAEALRAPQREIIERAFGAPAYDTYGCREVMLVASECSERRGLHTSADHLVVEVDALQPGADATAMGDLVVTDLHNYGMPMVRYVNGDLAVPSTRACPCGRGLPLLERIEGRRLDTLRTPDGQLVPGEYVVYAFLPILAVKRYQVVQRELGAFDVTVVPGAGFGDATRDEIRANLRKAAGDSVELRIHEADDIAPSRSGKFRVTVSELA